MNISKYDGLGNTFAITKYIHNKDFKNLAIKVCNDSQFNTDGLIIVKENPLEMLFYNRDGTSAPMCGNGIRAFSLYLKDKQIIPNTLNNFNVKTKAGIMKVEVVQNKPFLCKVNMGKPVFNHNILKLKDTGPLISRKLSINNKEIDISIVFMGTIHTVVFVKNATEMVGNVLGEKICNHPLFLEKTNVNFVSVNSKEEIVVRTYERGVGYTKACGTGCAASFVIGKLLCNLNKQIIVLLQEGYLILEELGEKGEEEIFMTGPATHHFDLDI